MTPEAERVVFSSAAAPLGKIVRSRKPELMAEVAKLGLDFERLAPAYPIDVWSAVVRTLARGLFPAEAADVAEMHLGETLFREYAETTLGKAVVAMLKLLGPHRTVRRISRSFRSTNNYYEDRVTQVGENDFEVWVNDVYTPALSQGILREGLEHVGARDCRVDLLSRDASGATLRVHWS